MLIRFSMSMEKSRAERKYAADTPLSRLVIFSCVVVAAVLGCTRVALRSPMHSFPSGLSSLTC